MRMRWVLAVGVSAIANLAAAQEWKWPEQPKNLMELKGFTGARLSPVMRGFTRSLGVRCTHCHVGEEGKPLSTYDFASDANPNKNRARAMLRMLGSINEQLKKIEPSATPRVNMWCHTCHRGRPRPLSLGEELTQAYGASGGSGAVARYKDLKTRFYGRGSYDFGEHTLTDFGYEVLNGKKDAEGAIAVFQLLTAEFPASANSWDSLAEAYMVSGKKELAIANYKKSLELDPKNDNARKKLEELQRATAGDAKGAS